MKIKNFSSLFFAVSALFFTQLSFATAEEVGHYDIVYVGRTFDGTNTTFTYTVTGLDQDPALSHFNVEVPSCYDEDDIVATSPADSETTPVEFGTDPTTGVRGIKWDFGLEPDQSMTYSITYAGDIAEGMVLVDVGYKAGQQIHLTLLPGAGCPDEETTTTTTVTTTSSTSSTTSTSTSSTTTTTLLICDAVCSEENPDQDDDQDGVSNCLELEEGTNPCDNGSFNERLDEVACAGPNGFFNQVNVATTNNLSPTPQTFRLELTALDGSFIGAIEYTLDAYLKRDMANGQLKLHHPNS